ncbi:unnamed protein product [Haemonchus placei]|uniref:G protein-coupled receptor n=1 Tax=Haemonchus placei TaxID=6290 RepID=A0A0N4W3R2_HAEPC|nr:unnamed protein product [Haemonchus placei]
MIECEDFDLSTGFYLVFMHSLSVVAVPLNLLSFYCILTKSPQQMAAYKWYLLIYQIISTVFDSVYLVFTLPIIFFPIPMGYPASWTIPWIPITTHMSVLLVIYIGSLFGATIVSLFMYRCHVITPARHFSKISGVVASGALSRHGYGFESQVDIRLGQPSLLPLQDRLIGTKLVYEPKNTDLYTCWPPQAMYEWKSNAGRTFQMELTACCNFPYIFYSYSSEDVGRKGGF